MVRTRRSPWDVPVELVPGAVNDLRDGAVRPVSLDVALPGIAGLQLITARLGGRIVLARIEPVAAEIPSAAPLAVVLRSLGHPVPILAVGTVLRRAVLAALLSVPAGTTVTYGELAARAGAPRAARAAARAMAVNPVPLVLPCHRVVPARGGIGAHGWGYEVKAALLAVEGLGPSDSGARRLGVGR